MDILIFARLARMLAKESPCKRRGVACVVFDADTSQIVGWGVNEPAHGRICSGEKDNCGCLHSEVNTVLNSRSITTNNHMVCSRAPCTPCASVIVNCGFITKVYVLDESEPGAHGIGVLKSAGIDVEFISCPEGAEIGLRDGSVANTEVLDIVALKHKLAVVNEKLKTTPTLDLVGEKNKLEKQIKQIS